MTFAKLRQMLPLVLALPCLAAAGQSLAAPAFTLTGGIPKTLTSPALAAAEKTQTPGQVSADGKTLTFTSQTVRLVAVTGPEDDMLSYRIAGHRSPTLSVPAGATVMLLFVNTDGDMRHDFRFGTVQKSFPNTVTAASVGTPELAPRSRGVLHGDLLTVRVPSAAGTYAYFCTVRGHAEGGMTGKLRVR